MKCPVCDNEKPSLLCRKCGFDSSRDYEKYPTFGAVGRVSSVSARRREWRMKQEKEEAVLTKPPQMEHPQKKRKLLPLLLAAAFALTLGLGVWIGSQLGNGKTMPTEPGESVQMQAPVETTAPGVVPVPDHATEDWGQSETEIDRDAWMRNVLRSDVPPGEDYNGSTWPSIQRYSVFGSKYQRKEIGSVHFLDTLEHAPEDAWDVSQEEDGSVLAWVTKNSQLYDLYIGADGGVNAPESCRGLFLSYSNVQTIDFGNAFHTVNVRDMSDMFADCVNLTALDLSRFDTTNVQDMSSMFQWCKSLESLDLSGFMTDNVQDMNYMFAACESLTSLNVDGFVTEKVENMNYMFSGCTNLAALDLRSFDTSKIDSMDYMFYDCKSLSNLKLSERFVIRTKNEYSVFLNCPAVVS